MRPKALTAAALLCLAAGTAGLAAAPAAEPLRLPPGVPVVADPAEPGPVLRAAEDLQRDLQWVLGAPSPLLNRLPSEDAPAIVIAGRGPEAAGLRDAAVAGPEAHAVFVRGNRVVLQGADMRGTIYAVYSFSDRYLDVPPWWFWADWKSARRAAVDVPRDAGLRWASPQVTWRAWFPNDQDLLSPWIQKDYAPRWNLLVETMLRLKLNMIDIGELNEKDLRKVQIPRDRGLALTTTHLAPFGASLRNWTKFWAARGRTPPPTLTLADVSTLEAFWEAHIRLAMGQSAEMLWMIGFRGDGDKGFYKTFPDAPSDAAGRARVVGDMLRRQVALLKRVTGDDHPPMRAVFYDECSDYLAAGLLQPPDELSLIWNFVNARRDHFPAADIRQLRAPPERPLGYYFNAQFTETGSHLADGEGPWKMERNFRMVRESGSNLVFSVINSGNTREFPLTLAAHARMMWDFASYDTDRFVGEFCQRYWGPDGGPEAARLYRDFFAAYWQQRRPDLPDIQRQYIFQDLRVARAARELLKFNGIDVGGAELLGDRDMGYYRIVPEDSGATSKREAVRIGCAAAAARFQSVSERATALATRLPAQGRSFFEQGLGRQAAFMAAACRAAAAAAMAAGVVGDPDAYRRVLAEARDAAGAMQAALDRPEPERFVGWYAPEQIFKVAETRAMIDRRLRGMTPK